MCRNSTYTTICIALVAATVLTYWPVFSGDFVSIDDPEYVKSNHHVLNGLSRSGWWYAWTSRDCANWHPLTWLSLELDGGIWGRNPTGYHATNLGFHSFNALLLFVALHQMSTSLFKSACVAFFFALHPLHVESVAWISERKDVLSTSFLLLTIIAYVSYASCPSRTRYMLVFACFFLGLLAKPMLVTLPVLLMLLDLWPLDRVAWNTASDRSDPATTTTPTDGASVLQGHAVRLPQQSLWRLLIEKLPLLVMAFLDGVITIFAQHDATNALSRLTFDARIANAFHAYVWYLHKTFVPMNLIVFYPHPERTLSWDTIAVEVLIFFAITLVVFWCRKSKPHLFFGWSWFVISLLPVIGLLQVGGQAYADRYTYIPHIGLFVAIVWEGCARVGGTRTGSVAAGLIAVISLVACVPLARSQVGYWKNDDSLWSHAIEVDSNNFFAHEHLVDARIAEGEYELAITHCERVVELNRSWNLASTLCNWGRCLVALNRPDEAEQKFLAALSTNPNHEPSLYELSELLRKQGRTAEAASVAEKHAALSVWQAKNQPENPAAQISLGLAFVQKGNPNQALLHFEKAAQLAPNSAEALANLGMVQIQVNRLDQAKSNFRRVLELNPNLPAIHFCLAQILEREHDIPGARRHFAEALRLNASDQDAKKNLERLSKL